MGKVRTISKLFKPLTFYCNTFYCLKPSRTVLEPSRTYSNLLELTRTFLSLLEPSQPFFSPLFTSRMMAPSVGKCRRRCRRPLTPIESASENEKNKKQKQKDIEDGQSPVRTR